MEINVKIPVLEAHIVFDCEIGLKEKMSIEELCTVVIFRILNHDDFELLVKIFESDSFQS